MYLSPTFLLVLIYLVSIFSLELIADLYSVTENERFYFYSLFLFVSVILSVFIAFIKKRWASQPSVWVSEVSYYRFFYTFIFVTIFELFYSGNVPLLSVVGMGSRVSYTDYGIRGLHGLVNGMHLALICCSVVAFFLTRKKKFLILGTLLFLWCFFLFSRQLILSGLVVGFFAYIGFRSSFRIRLLGAAKIIFGATIFVLIFGGLGDFRTGSMKLFGVLGYEPKYELFNYSVVQWLLTYLSSPLVNVINNIGYENSVFSVFSPLLPSFIRDTVFFVEPLFLEISIFNVAAAPHLYTSSLGYFGVVLYLAIFSSVEIFFRCSRSPKIRFAGSIYLYHAAFFSFFTDFLLSLPFLSMLFFCFSMLRSSKSVKSI